MISPRAIAALCGAWLMFAAGPSPRRAGVGSASPGAPAVRRGDSQRCVLDGRKSLVRRRRGDQDGRFAKVGRVEGRGVREIDAREILFPGWIDMMDQSKFF
jgi:hypothetical protein